MAQSNARTCVRHGIVLMLRQKINQHYPGKSGRIIRCLHSTINIKVKPWHKARQPGGTQPENPGNKRMLIGVALLVALLSCSLAQSAICS